MERLALVICSEWHAVRAIPELAEAAAAVSRVLTDPVTGGWTPALPERPLVLDPAAAELDEALRQAFQRAHERRAVLLVFFVGHGVLTEDDYYLMATDSTELPDSRDSLLLGQRFKELLRRYSDLGALVLVVDACHSGRAIQAAGRDFLQQISRARRRVEVLTASDDDPAYGACLARTVATHAAIGHAGYGEVLGTQDLHALARETCRLQVPQQFSFDGTEERRHSDPGLWLLRNPGSRWLNSPLAGSAQLGEVERLLVNRVQRPVFDEAERALAGSARCVLLHGPEGSGKSAVVANLLERGSPVHAAVLLRGEELLTQVAADLHDQLARQVDGFREAGAAYYGSRDLNGPLPELFELQLLGPLRLLPATAPVRIVVDGVDALPAQTRERLWAGLIALATDPVAPVRLLVAARALPAELAGAEVIPVPAATAAELTEFVRHHELHDHQVELVIQHASGSWAAAHLFAEGFAQRNASAGGGQVPRELADAFAERLRRAKLADEKDPRTPHTRLVLGTVAAAGAGPVLPMSLLVNACGLAEAEVHDVLPRLDTLIVRGQPGTPAEQLGLAEPELAAHLADGSALGVDPAHWHARLADAITELAPPGAQGPAAAYAEAAEARHRWQAGRHVEALDGLDEREPQIPAEQRERWRAFARLTEQRFGADHPLTFRALTRIGTWTAKAGDPATALATFAELLDRARPLLGAEHPEVLNLRENQAFWLGESGDWPRALELFTDLVADCAQLLGPEHPQTLMAQHHLALSTAKLTPERAFELFLELLPLRERVLGPDHVDTLRTRHNLAFWEVWLAYPPPLRFSFQRLVSDLTDSVGPAHTETLTARYHQAVFLPDSERPQAIALLRGLRPDVVRVLGPWHADVRRIDEWLGERREESPG